MNSIEKKKMLLKKIKYLCSVVGMSFIIGSTSPGNTYASSTTLTQSNKKEENDDIKNKDYEEDFLEELFGLKEEQSTDLKSTKEYEEYAKIINTKNWDQKIKNELLENDVFKTTYYTEFIRYNDTLKDKNGAYPIIGIEDTLKRLNHLFIFKTNDESFMNINSVTPERSKQGEVPLTTIFLNYNYNEFDLLKQYYRFLLNETYKRSEYSYEYIDSITHETKQLGSASADFIYDLEAIELATKSCKMFVDHKHLVSQNVATALNLMVNSNIVNDSANNFDPLETLRLTIDPKQKKTDEFIAFSKAMEIIIDKENKGNINEAQNQKEIVKDFLKKRYEFLNTEKSINNDSAFQMCLQAIDEAFIQNNSQYTYVRYISKEEAQVVKYNLDNTYLSVYYISENKDLTAEDMKAKIIAKTQYYGKKLSVSTRKMVLYFQEEYGESLDSLSNKINEYYKNLKKKYNSEDWKGFIRGYTQESLDNFKDSAKYFKDKLKELYEQNKARKKESN